MGDCTRSPVGENGGTGDSVDGLGGTTGGVETFVKGELMAF